MARSIFAHGGAPPRRGAPFYAALATVLALGMMPSAALADTAGEPDSALLAEAAQSAQTPPQRYF